MVDENTLRQWAEWGQTVPSFFPSVIIRLGQALAELLAVGGTKLARWQALKPRLDSLVNVLYPMTAIGNIGWTLPAWDANLALCILNFPDEWTDSQMLECAIGKETFYPVDEKTLEDNFSDAKLWTDSEAARNAGSRNCCC